MEVNTAIKNNMNTKFYIFNQNNSGGRWRIDLKNGISHIVIIEAKNAKEANSRAVSAGVYFDGVEDGSDCECCGDRWSRVRDDDWDYKNTLEEIVMELNRCEYTKREKSVYVHYIDGRFEKVDLNPGPLKN
jgi:hypothetical protein